MQRKMKKRIISIVTICGLVMSLMTGCKVQTQQSGVGADVDVSGELAEIMEKYDASQYVYEGEECTITMAHWDSSGANIERAVVEAVLEGFSARYPEITVQLEILQDYENTYGNKLAAGTAHDVFLVPDGVASSWSPSGKLLNLSPYIEESKVLTNLDDIYDSCLTRYQYNSDTKRMGSGDQYALPKDVGPYVLYYNKDWFKEMGVELPPSDRVMTIDEATTMWQALTKKTDTGVITGYGTATLPPEGLVWSAGGDFLNEDRTGFPTDADTLAGLAKGYQYVQDAYFKYQVVPPSSFSGTVSGTNLFAQQKVATLISGRWEVSTFRELSFDWDIAYVPGFEEDPMHSMYSGSVGYGVNAASKHTEAAYKLVEYIASEEGQEILTATGFQIPVYETLALDKALVDSEKEKGPENYEIFVGAAKNQGYGLWQYYRNTLWKVNGFDVPSEYLVSEDESTRITVEEYLNRAKDLVNSNIK